MVSGSKTPANIWDQAATVMAVAAAHAVLDVVRDEALCERSEALGVHMRSRLTSMRGAHPSIAEVRGLGAMTAIEFCHDGDPARPAPEIANALKDEAARRGLLLLTCGIFGNVLRIMVPLTIPQSVLDEGLDIIESSLQAIAV